MKKKRNNKAIVKGEFTVRNDYSETIRAIPMGETHSFNMAGTVYTGLLSASSRLKGEGIISTIKSCRRTNLVFVSREQ